ncbi:MupG family TIM beta-alpha barrel fold protein [Rummeliibacillus sp. NPDC094406]|uniref:MupG family TIM beta-alpha barrel fold protein n=1 Tax=Rummeliibacillus sp. NPDC094406 TaxID=3364511 RepID=UPI003819A3F4
MFGFSMYLNKDLTESDYYYIRDMKEIGFEEVFTSLHIPEYDASLYKGRLSTLGNLCKNTDLRLTVDISPSALEAIGLTLENAEEIQEMGITGIRFDYGFTMEEIAALSKKMFVALNASTIIADNVEVLKQYDANFEKIEAWHNYYPRNETGLSKQFLEGKNSALKKWGFTTMAFVPGDKQLRGPIFTGLPTLEKHRGRHSLSSAIELLNDTSTDKVFIGDPRIGKETMNQYKAFLKGRFFLLYGTLFDHAPDYITKSFHNRFDGARDVVRFEEARSLVTGMIKPQNTVERGKGSITIDNFNYGRYMGEIQITRSDLPSDNRVNVIGDIRKEDLDLLLLIGAGQKVMIKEVNG